MYRVAQHPRPLHSTAHICNMPKPIYMIFGKHQHHFVFNSPVNLIFFHFITQSGDTWRKSATKISLSTTPIAIISALDVEWTVWPGCWTQSTAAVCRKRPYTLWLYSINCVLVGDLMCSEVWKKVSQASGSEWWCHLECVLQQNGGNIKHFEWKNDVYAVHFS